MAFEIKVSSHSPIASDDLNEILENFLLDIGYLSGRKTGEEVYGSVPFRLWTDVFLKHPDKPITVDEIATMLETSKPTIYRHLNKLKNMDLVESEEVVIEDNGEVIKKGYKLRQGDLLTAWHITEANIESTLKRYKETVKRIKELSKGR
ncbi:MAG: ArsR family transcriptional regulator [Thermoplasmatota archaeon]